MYRFSSRRCSSRKPLTKVVQYLSFGMYKLQHFNQFLIFYLYYSQEGISRSASCLCAYLMYEHGLTLYSALSLCRKGRPVIDPNPGFRKQLQRYWRKCTNLGNDYEVQLSELKLHKLNFFERGGRYSLSEHNNRVVIDACAPGGE